MENKINIAELLKNCPKGMELYSTIYGTVYFEGVRDTGNAVLIDVKTSCNTEAQFYPDGKFNTYYSDSEMTLFPSKDVRTWEGFIPPCKFKVGDRVKLNNSRFIYTITDLLEDRYRATIDSNDLYEIAFERQDAYKLVSNKFDITTLIPFESKVLVRDCDTENWCPAIWGFTDSENYYTVGGVYLKQCIPYEENKHLLGTDNDCDKFYKTWE